MNGKGLRRVVVTGLGIVSPIGNSATEVSESLREGRSGIVRCDTYEEMGFRSQIHGEVNINFDDYLDKKDLRFMGDGAAYNYISMNDAIKDSGLEQKEISNEMTGIIVGSGGPSTQNLLKAFELG